MVAALWLALVIGRYAEVTAAALYGRDINLFWDLRFVPDVVALLARPERLWVVALAAGRRSAVSRPAVSASRVGPCPARRCDRPPARASRRWHAGRGDPGVVRGPTRRRRPSPDAFPAARHADVRPAGEAHGRHPWPDDDARAESADECRPLHSWRGGCVPDLRRGVRRASATSVPSSPLASRRTGRNSKRRFTRRARALFRRTSNRPPLAVPRGWRTSACSRAWTSAITTRTRC